MKCVNALVVMNEKIGRRRNMYVCNVSKKLSLLVINVCLWLTKYIQLRCLRLMHKSTLQMGDSAQSFLNWKAATTFVFCAGPHCPLVTRVVFYCCIITNLHAWPMLPRCSHYQRSFKLMLMGIWTACVSMEIKLYHLGVSLPASNMTWKMWKTLVRYSSKKFLVQYWNISNKLN